MEKEAPVASLLSWRKIAFILVLLLVTLSGCLSSQAEPPTVTVENEDEHDYTVEVYHFQSSPDMSITYDNGTSANLAVTDLWMGGKSYLIVDVHHQPDGAVQVAPGTAGSTRLESAGEGGTMVYAVKKDDTGRYVGIIGHTCASAISDDRITIESDSIQGAAFSC